MIQKHNRVHSSVVENLLPNPAEQGSNPLLFRPAGFPRSELRFYTGFRQKTAGSPVQLLTDLLRWTGPAKALVRSFTGPTAGRSGSNNCASQPCRAFVAITSGALCETTKLPLGQP